MPLHLVVSGTLDPVHDKIDALIAAAASNDGIRFGERMRGSAHIILPVR